MSFSPARLMAASLLVLAANAAQSQRPDPDPVPFATCISTLRRELPQHPEVRPDTFDTHTRATC